MTAPLPAVYDIDEVAAALGESPGYVATKCRRSEWPHLKGARGRPKFTADQYARILELIAQDPAAEQETSRINFAPRSRRRAS